MRRQSLTTMQLKLKLSTSEDKFKKLSWLKNQFRKLIKEFSIFLLKLKLFTILKEIITLQLPPKPELNILELSKEDIKEEKSEKLEDKAKSEEKNTLSLSNRESLKLEFKVDLLLPMFQEEIMLKL